MILLFQPFQNHKGEQIGERPFLAIGNSAEPGERFIIEAQADNIQFLRWLLWFSRHSKIFDHNRLHVK